MSADESRVTVKDCIKGTAKFLYYRKGMLYYICENGFHFSIPTNDTGDASFNAEDNGILFMRWIRKDLEAMKDKLS